MSKDIKNIVYSLYRNFAIEHDRENMKDIIDSLYRYFPYKELENFNID